MLLLFKIVKVILLCILSGNWVYLNGLIYLFGILKFKLLDLIFVIFIYDDVGFFIIILFFFFFNFNLFVIFIVVKFIVLGL